MKGLGLILACASFCWFGRIPVLHKLLLKDSVDFMFILHRNERGTDALQNIQRIKMV